MTTDRISALAHFAGTVAHELNNIFTAVTGNLSLLEWDRATDEPPLATLEDVMRAAQRGVALSAKLQAFSGRQPLRRKRVDVNQAVHATLGRMCDTELASIELRVRFAKAPCIALLDESKLHAMIEELIRNACEAMAGKGSLTVETAAIGLVSARKGDPARRGVLLRITDTGAGMSEEILNRAFEPLFSTKPGNIDVGWGLSNCRGFVRQSGGEITLASKPEHGTHADVVFPLED